jgi:hypothetical protein
MGPPRIMGGGPPGPDEPATFTTRSRPSMMVPFMPWIAACSGVGFAVPVMSVVCTPLAAPLGE